MTDQPANDLCGGAVLGGVVRGDLRRQRRGQRPGLRAIDHDLGEPHRVRVGSQPSARLAGGRVEPCDPWLVVVTVQNPDPLDTTIWSGDEPLRQARALGQVVVVDPCIIRLEMRARSSSIPSVHLHPAMHATTTPTTVNGFHQTA